MSTAAKSPAELIADLTDQVRLLRQDVGNLTATATTKAEAARLMARIEKASGEAFAHAQEVIDASEHLGRRMHQDSASAAQVAAQKAIKSLEHEISAAANHMRLESVRSSKEALHRFGGGVWPSSEELRLWGAFLASWRCFSSKDAAMHGNSESIRRCSVRQPGARSPPTAMADASAASGSIAEADELMEVARGVLQLQDMADVNRNCISASALCSEPSFQDHF